MNPNEEHDQTHSGRDQESRSNVLEKIFTVLSLILIMIAVGFLIKESMTEQTPAAFSLKPAPPIIRGNFLAVDVYVENSGDQAAKAVNIKGELPGPDGEPLEAETTMDWLPGRSTRRVTLIFPEDAPTSAPKVEVIGYEEP